MTDIRAKAARVLGSLVRTAQAKTGRAIAEDSDGGVVRVCGARLPLGQGRFVRDFPAGCCVQEIVEGCLPAEMRPFAVVAVEGASVPPQRWSKVRIRPGRNATIHIAPAGGASLAGAGFAALRIFSTFANSYGLPGALGEEMETPPSSTSYGLEGGANQLRPYGAIPRVFGKIRFAPPLANHWVPLRRGVPSLYGMLCWGLGELKISDTRLDQTPIGEFRNWVSINTLYLPAKSFYPHPRRVVEIGTDLNEPQTITRRIGYIGVSIRIQLVFPRGLYRQRSSGVREATSVELRVRVTRVGVASSAVTTHHITATPEVAPFHTAFYVYAPAGDGVVDVEIERHTAKGTAEFIRDLSIVSASTWLEELLFRTSVTVSNLYMNAPGQKRGQLPVFSGVVQAKLPAWDSSTNSWTPALTRNPAAAFREVLLGDANARPLAESQLHMEALQDWFNFCEEQKLTYDAVLLRRRSVAETLAEIAAAGKARSTWVDGRCSVIIDRPRAARVQVFSPRNMVRFSGQRKFSDPAPHALRLPYRDEEHDYNFSEMRVYRPGYDSSNATLIEEQRLPGVTNASALSRHAAHQLAARLQRRESYEIEADWEQLVATRGDRVGITHDTLSRTTHSARVVEVKQVGNNNEVRLDTPAPSFQVGLSYRAVVRGENISEPLVVTEATSPGWLSVAGAVQKGDLLLLGPSGSTLLDCIIEDIEPGADASARLRLIPYGGDSVFNPDLSTYTIERSRAGNFVHGTPFGGINLPGKIPDPPIGETNREYAYIRTRQKERPDVPVSPAGSLPPGWTANAAGVDSSLRYEWRSERTMRDGVWSSWSTPALLALYPAIGETSREYAYIRTRQKTRPGVPTSSAGSLPRSWTANAVGVDRTWHYEWRSERALRNGIWSAWSTPALFALYSAIGETSREYAYIRTQQKVRPGVPTSSAGSLPRSWTANAVGVDRTWHYEWRSERALRNGVWSAWSTPALFTLYSAIGETSREYAYIRTQQKVRPGVPTSSAGSIPRGWTANAVGVDRSWHYEWRSERALRNGVWSAWSTPALFALYSAIGETSREYAYIRTQQKAHPGVPTSSAGSLPRSWTANAVGVDSTWHYEWRSERALRNGVWSAWSTPALFALYSAIGETSREYAYIRTRQKVRPGVPTSPTSGARIPRGWTANAVGVDSTWHYEWRSERARRDGVWSSWSTPALRAVYPAIGETNREYAYIRTQQRVRPGVPVSPTRGTHIPQGWTANAVGLDRTWRYEWRSERTLRDGVWSSWSTPALLALYPEPEPVPPTQVSPTAHMYFRAIWEEDDRNARRSISPRSVTGRFTGPVNSIVKITGILGGGVTPRYTHQVTGGAVTIQEIGGGEQLELIVRQTASGAEWRVILEYEEIDDRP